MHNIDTYHIADKLNRALNQASYIITSIIFHLIMTDQDNTQDNGQGNAHETVEKRIKLPIKLNTLLLTDCRIQNPFNIEGSVERLVTAILTQFYEQPENKNRVAKALGLLQ